MNDPQTTPISQTAPALNVPADLEFERQTQARIAELERANAQLRAVATAAAYVYRALGYHQTIVHPAPFPAPALPMRDLYEALLAAGYTSDGEYVEVPAALAPAAGSHETPKEEEHGAIA